MYRVPSVLTLFACMLGGAAPAPAAAQWSGSGVGVVEYDTNETLLLLAGVSFGPGGMGWSPVVGLQMQYLTFDRGLTDNASIWSVRPSAGIRNGFDGGAVQVRAGYAFVSDDAERGFPSATILEDTGEGFVLSGAADYWGTGGPIGAQALASYNFGSESLWTRGRVTTRVASLNSGGQIRVGGEAAWMNSGDYSALQPGGVLEWHNGGGLIVGLGVGMKLIEDGDDPVYFRGEIVLPIMR